MPTTTIPVKELEDSGRIDEIAERYLELARLGCDKFFKDIAPDLTGGPGDGR